MADKKYKLKFQLTSGKVEEVQFTVPQGETGAQGPQGPQGERGPMYELTDADRAGIVADVIEALPVYNGEVASE